ncbi:endonuclease III [Candidatus Tachikawaea gelatinosa]|uniref:Endonuclease III n=1 Tax=Candidatus Tachikawaea gelatinosa TaxID=1410383 RepID=A0A090ART2_9ENTR|nr:endonuclease III [Candidatus Tachikawaea gelatinosa]BAP58525.1 endonuclease III [Candidatus Tachikawaea gelatinosa]
MNKKKCIKIFEKLQNCYNIETMTLEFNSPFELLISVMLSAQTRDINVNKSTKKLYAIANTPEKMLNIGLDQIKFFIKNLGLFNIKSKNIISICKILIYKYNSVIPNNRQDLESLPGIGRKTANIILNYVFNFPTIAVDTHVFRIANRTGLAIGNNVNIVEKKLLQIVPKEMKKKCHFLLVKHGRIRCKAKFFNCSLCIIQNLCEYKEKRL